MHFIIELLITLEIGIRFVKRMIIDAAKSCNSRHLNRNLPVSILRFWKSTESSNAAQIEGKL